MDRKYPEKEAAEALGHTVEWDPPGLSSARRWTCTACGKAALCYAGNVYGSATTDSCHTPAVQLTRDTNKEKS